jgi:hypothetical protein
MKTNYWNKLTNFFETPKYQILVLQWVGGPSVIHVEAIGDAAQFLLQISQKSLHILDKISEK